MIVFITKYCLTSGIERAEVKDVGNGMVTYGEGYGQIFFHPGDWFATRDAAEAKAEQMRTRKIASLRKSIAKLEALSFVEPKE